MTTRAKSQLIRAGRWGSVAAIALLVWSWSAAVGGIPAVDPPVPSGASAFVTSSSPLVLVLSAGAYARAARSVRLTGTVRQIAAEYSVDVSLFANGDSDGKVTIHGNTAHIRVVGDLYYLQGSVGFWTTSFGEATSAAKRLSAEWVSVRRSSISGLGANLTMAHLRSGFALSRDLQFTTTGASRLDGTAAVGIRIPAKGTLWVAASSPHRPLAFDGMNDGNLLAVHFSNWGGGTLPRPPSRSQFLPQVPN
jgi:hypothetical protein